MSEPAAVDGKLGRRLVLDELFDLSLYQCLRDIATGELRSILDQLIPIEARHFAFWQDFFDLHVEHLDPARRLEASTPHPRLPAVRRSGDPSRPGGDRGVRRAEVPRESGPPTATGPLGAAVRSILEDEFEHEDAVVTGDAERRLNPERVRNIFLGLNDGLVEILGAVSGFFAAFGNSVAVLAAGVTVAVAGALSMAAGAWVATSSEAEVRATETGRRRFLGESVPPGETGEHSDGLGAGGRSRATSPARWSRCCPVLVGRDDGAALAWSPREA